MRTSGKKQLLNEVLSGDELDGLRDATLTGGLVALRARARCRRAFQAAAIVAPLLILTWRWRHHPPARPEAVAAAPAAVGTGKVKYITEKELFALFPRRPIALIGEAGHQQLLLLDELGKTGQ
jgi:hypothetical protein